IVTVVDAVNAPTQLDAHFECVKQIAVADRIVLSKSDLATPSTTRQLGIRLAALNPGAETWQVVRGEVGPELIFRVGTSKRNERSALESWLRGGGEQADCSHHEHGEDHSHDDHAKPHAHHRDNVRSYSFWLDDPVHPEALRIWLDQLATFRGPKLLRVKGILNVDGWPTVIHAVQHLFHPPESLERWPSEERRSRIVVIAHQLEREQIEATLPLLAFRPQRNAQNKIDPRTFLDFSAAMRRIHGADAE
ncbi:MAG: CobW family GTP-binding protein, partial [Terriglobia bacterium]